MAQIGEVLKEKRESKGLTLSQVEEETKIRIRYLQALEEGNYALIPGKVYVKGFLRTYATFLGLNALELSEEYEKTTINTKPVIEEVPSRKKTKRKKQRDYNFTWNPKYNKYLGMIGAIILLVAVANFYPVLFNVSDSPREDDNLRERIEDQADLEQGNNDGENEVQSPEGDPPMAEEEPVIEGINVVLAATNGRSWIRVRVDGEEVFQGTLESGDRESFQGDDNINVRFGNPRAIEITVNDENIGVIDERNPVTREFTAEDEEREED